MPNQMIGLNKLHLVIRKMINYKPKKLLIELQNFQAIE